VDPTCPAFVHLSSVCSTAASSEVEHQRSSDYPVLLGRELSQPFTPMVKVKNTFIDGFDEDGDEEEDGPMMCAVKSCPVTRTPFTLRSPAGLAPSMKMSLEAVDEIGDMAIVQDPCEQQQADTRVAQKSPALGSGLLAAPAPAPLGLFGAPYSAASPSTPMTPATADCGAAPMPPQPVARATVSSCAPVAAAAAKARQQGVVPLEERRPEMSLGSDIHGTGECRPCAWFWRPQGCANGYECRHCHLCPVGEVKARRKTKIASLRTTTRSSPSAAVSPASAAAPSAAQQKEQQTPPLLVSRGALPRGTTHDAPVPEGMAPASLKLACLL